MHKIQGIHNKVKTHGFTLIELLVVVVVISISIAVVVVNISFNGDEEKLEEEVTRLQQILNFAHQQSVIRAEEVGIRFYQNGYRFMRFDEENRRWANLNNDRLLRSRQLPDSIELDLYIDQVPVDIAQSQEDEPEPKSELKAGSDRSSNAKTSNSTPDTSTKKIEIKPHVFLLSSAELTPPFEIRLRIPGSDFEQSLEGLPQGKYQRLNADE